VSADFEVTGAAQLLRLSKALKNAGELELRKELNRGIRAAAKPLIGQARAEARRRLPQRGGLAQRVGRQPARVTVKTGQTPGVQIVVGKKGLAAAADAGVIRHPVFGRGPFVSQQVPKGAFTDTFRDGAPTVLPEIEAAMERVAQTIVDRGR